MAEITDKDLKSQLFALRDDFYTLHDAYDSLQLLTTDTEIDAPRLSNVIQILNYRYDSLLRRFDGLV